MIFCAENVCSLRVETVEFAGRSGTARTGGGMHAESWTLVASFQKFYVV